jgi:Pyruvate/2-oxoacid:ferredoxin oxidoreductase gamma subunit
VAGFGGQGALLLGEVLAEAGLAAGLEVSWLPSYGPEMRSGTSNCHVRLSAEAIDSPLVTHPDVLVAMNEPSLHKFYESVRPGGWVLYNGDALPEGCYRRDLHMLTQPYTQIANDLGDARAGNMVMLGALLELTGTLPQQAVDASLRLLVKSAKWLELDERALTRGRDLLRKSVKEVLREG